VRLHHLAITGFGPFAASEEVDFDALSSSGLFLIHGATGAGKSSILDAICFALYAAVPGARAGSRASLRSDHAAAGVVPEVTLEFTASGRRMRVCRSPEFSRLKKRGTGETTVPAKVVLEEHARSRWEVLGTRNDEVALILKDVLGMGMEQFTKVVLLPQGEFAAFLRANPEERRSLLEKLFDTQRFTDIETWLGERRRRAAEALGIARGRLSTGLLRVDDVLARLDPGEDIVGPPWPEVPPESVDTTLTGLLGAVDLRAISALAGVEVATATAVKTEFAVHQGRAVTGHQKTAAEARGQLRALDEHDDAYQKAMRVVADAERAGAVSGFLAAAVVAARLQAAAEANVAALRVPVARLLPRARPAARDGSDSQTSGEQTADNAVDKAVEQAGPAAVDEAVDEAEDQAEVDVAATQMLIDQLAGHSDSLQQAVAQAARARLLAKESDEHALAVRRDDGSALAAAREVASAELSRTAAEVTRDEGRAAAATLSGIEAWHRSLIRIQRLLLDQARSAGDLEVLQLEAGAADGRLLDARGHLLDLRERRLAGMAAELAGGIPPGAACPVCGSCVHPDLAQSTDVVSSSDLQSAEADQALAAETIASVRSKVAALHAGRAARALEIAADQQSTQALEAPGAIVAAATAIDDARAAAASLPRAQVQLDRLDHDLERLRRRIEQTSAARASSAALAASTKRQSQDAQADVTRLLADHNGSCPCATADHEKAEHEKADHKKAGHEPVNQGEAGDEQVTQVATLDAVTQVASRHRLWLADLRSLARGLHELLTHLVNAREADLRLSKALQDNGFPTRSEAQAALRPVAEVQELTKQLRTQEQQRARAEALLVQRDVIDAMTQPAPDVETLAEVHRLALGSLTEASRRHTLSEQAQRDLRALYRTVSEVLVELGPAEQEARLVQDLADCVAGNSADNALRMRLSAYVLAARLEEIATLANDRLLSMSDGRYALEYTDARAARGARSGLGLLVRDAWTGRSRETSSLSGGEAFMASLALALGLGDAVRAEAGGFDLQTLFVDEGFGALDEDSLEQVMAVLDTLREGGRAVGIVSHVPELRTRIGHQLQVLKHQGGSRISTLHPKRPAA